MQTNDPISNSNQQTSGSQPIDASPATEAPASQQPVANKETPWYRDWRSWLTIILLLFIPISLLGLVLMWLVAPWSKKAKRWITVIYIGIPLVVMLVFFLINFLTASSPGGKMDQAADYRRKSDIENIASAAHNFCIEKNRCPSALDELTQEDYSGYLHKIPTDPTTGEEYSYQLINEGQDCVIKTTLSSDEILSRNCIP